MATKKYDYSSLEGVKKIFEDAVEDMAHEVLWLIENQYEMVIEQFYADYNPLYYNRTYSTYSASSGYENLFSPQNIFGEDGQWTARIGVDSNNISGNPYRADTDWVFTRTFIKGIHGINTRKGMNATQKRKFKRYSGNYYKTYQVKLVPGKKYALKHVKITKHLIGNNTSFSDYIKTGRMGNIGIKESVMKNMVPAPSRLMREWWRKFSGKRNFDKIFKDVLNRKFG